MAAPTAALTVKSSLPPRFAAAVTKSDSAANNFAVPFRAIYVGGVGDVAVVMEGDGAAVVWPSVPAGTTIVVCGVRINSTGTTATNMVAQW